MLQKLSKTKITSKLGIKLIKIFSIYNKKRFKILHFFGPIKSAIKAAKTRRGHLVGKRVKGFVIQTRQSKIKPDRLKINFFSNKTLLKHRRLQRGKLN